MNQVRKAVVPAAGYGTRLLPVTKSISKEMLPIVDKPVIQLIVEELVAAGVTDVIIVTAKRKSDLRDYFGPVKEGLAQQLNSGNPDKQALLQSLENIQKLANITFVEQTGVYGTGTPVLCAAPYLEGEPFIYTFADDFFTGPKNSYQQMLEAFARYNAPVVACQRRTADSDYNRYGYVGGTELAPGEVDMRAIVEHPGKASAPGDLASLGGFVVTPEVLPYLERVRADLPTGKEFYFNSALGLMLADGKRLIAKEIEGQYHDTGNKLDYAKTFIDLALERPDIGPELRKHLRNKLE